MGEKLTWKEICKQFDREWVELVDYDWDLTEPNPKSGVVRVHSGSRKEFDRLLVQDPPSDSAIVFVGKVTFPENSVFSANHHQYARK